MSVPGRKISRKNWKVSASISLIKILSHLKGCLPGERMHFPVFACVEDTAISSFLKGQKKVFCTKTSTYWTKGKPLVIILFQWLRIEKGACKWQLLSFDSIPMLFPLKFLSEVVLQMFIYILVTIILQEDSRVLSMIALLAVATHPQSPTFHRYVCTSSTSSSLLSSNIGTDL